MLSAKQANSKSNMSINEQAAMGTYCLQTALQHRPLCTNTSTYLHARNNHRYNGTNRLPACKMPRLRFCHTYSLLQM